MILLMTWYLLILIEILNRIYRSFLLALNKKETQIYKQESDDNTKNILFNSLKLGLEKSSFKNREVINYDVITSKKNSHELVTVSDYPMIIRILLEN